MGAGFNDALVVKRATAGEFASETTLAAAKTSIDTVGTNTANLGASADAEATANGSVTAILKRIRTLLGQVVLAAGTALIGKVQVADSGGTNLLSVDAQGHAQADIVGALPAGTANIGDVDIASIAAGDNVIGRVKLSDGTNLVVVAQPADGAANTQYGLNVNSRLAGYNGTTWDLLRVDAAKNLQMRLAAGYNSIKSFAHGNKTVTSTAAEVFAGGSRLANRCMMRITNVGDQPVYIGGASVTAVNYGDVLYKGDSITINNMEPATAVAFYAITDTGTTAEIHVVEAA